MIKRIYMNDDQINIIYWVYVRKNTREYDLTKHAYREMMVMTNIRGIQDNYFNIETKKHQ